MVTYTTEIIYVILNISFLHLISRSANEAIAFSEKIFVCDRTFLMVQVSSIPKSAIMAVVWVADSPYPVLYLNVLSNLECNINQNLSCIYDSIIFDKANIKVYLS